MTLCKGDIVIKCNKDGVPLTEKDESHYLFVVEEPISSSSYNNDGYIVTVKLKVVK